MYKQNEEEYISLTDMAKFRDSERSDYIIQNWMRTRSTIEFLGLWEQLKNPNFKGIEFDAFRNESGSNSFALTPKRWITATNSIANYQLSVLKGKDFMKTLKKLDDSIYVEQKKRPKN